MKFLTRLFSRSRDFDPITAEERYVIQKCIRDGDIVFDVGAHHGKWSEEVLKARKAQIHAFEASSEAYEVLKGTISDRVTLNWNAVSNRNEDLTFHVYRDDARLSSLHRRHSVEEKLLGAGFEEIHVPGITLSQYWGDRTDQIRFLKVDVEGAEYDVLRGAEPLLRAGRIDFLQFEYGGTFFDAGTTLRNVWSLLRRFGYRVYRIDGSKLTELTKFRMADEDYKYSNFLGINARLAGLFSGVSEDIELDFERMAHFGIKPSGALHVGAHEGKEIKTYRRHNVSPVVFVEANPKLATALQEKFAGVADVKVIEAAASNEAGEATFNITSMDQSSSLLPLKEHSELYPKIGVARQITVRTERLDALLAEHGIDPASLNFIAMDIQGAELMALRGAEALLPHIKALQIEINFSELYQGCALISDIDAYLRDFDFIRVMTKTPYSETWGDALYVRRPVVTCSAVGSLGRFGNHIFQYMFIQCYAQAHDFIAMNGVWSGDDMFNVAPGVEELPPQQGTIEEQAYELHDSEIANDPEVRPATDFSGFFQYHTRYYLPNKLMIRDHFSFKGAYAQRAAEIEELFARQKGPVATIHLRRGDFGTGVFFIAPEEWYIKWLTELRQIHPDLVVYIASDELDAVQGAFSDFTVLTERDLPETTLDHGFFTDFAALTLGDQVAISNSSFSFAASLLNTRADAFVRPNLKDGRLMPYMPWDAPVLLRDTEAEDAGEEFMSEKAKGRSKYKLRKLTNRVRNK